MLDGSKATVRESLRVRRATSNFRWPGGARVAVVFNIAYQGWSDETAQGQGAYGATRGIQRLMRIADVNRIKTSVMTNGIIAERHAATVAALVQGGHEIVAHSHAMDANRVDLDEAGVRADIARTKSVLEAAANARVTGWISPRGDASPSRWRWILTTCSSAFALERRRRRWSIRFVRCSSALRWPTISRFWQMLRRMQMCSADLRVRGC
jgi:peptidoglycan/xylan/chitin deacetylase (PgdA/CDA1 family)